MSVQIYLTRRNLETLLAKLDKNIVHPGTSAVTIVKHDTTHPTHPQTGADDVWVSGVENEEYYKHRLPGVTMEDLENE